MAHIKATQAANPALMFKDVLKLAGKTYKKGTKVVSNAVGAKKSRKSKKMAKKSGKASKKRSHKKKKTVKKTKSRRK